MNGREMCAQAGQSEIVTVRKPYFRWLGSLHMAIFLDEMLFRQGAAGDDEWEMTDAELSEKLCLTVDAIKRCRAEMVSLGFLSVERRGLPCRSFYRANTSAIADGFTSFLEDGIPVSGKQLTRQRMANVKDARQRETANRSAENRSPSIYTGVKAGKDVKTLGTHVLRSNGTGLDMAAGAACLTEEKPKASVTPTATATLNLPSVTDSSEDPARAAAIEQLYNNIAADTGYGWGGYLKQDGTARAHIGQLWGVLGKLVAADPVRALGIWSDFAGRMQQHAPSKLGARDVVKELRLWLNGRDGVRAIDRARGML